LDFKGRDQKDPKVVRNEFGMGEAAITVNWRIPEWFPNLDAKHQEQLKALHGELLRFTKSVNLISVKTIANADAIHFADCILAADIISKAVKLDEIYDVGSGNGFPGLVFAILWPHVKIQMVEVDQRKAEYLKHCISFLGLTNANVLIRAVETLPEKSLQFAVSRGFASLAKSILSTRKVFKKGGMYFHLKGEEWANEIGSIPSQLCTFWSPSLVSEYKLPVGEITFAIVKTEKIAD
jgi:16S rRNA (guanine527-N7)-methyltransferase